MSFLIATIDTRGMHWLVPGRDYRLPPAEGPLTLLACFEQYIAEHCIPTGGDPERGIPPATIHQVAEFLADRVGTVEKTYAHLLPHNLASAVRVLH